MSPQNTPVLLFLYKHLLCNVIEQVVIFNFTYGYQTVNATMQVTVLV
eukprot:SAG11_NODE_520_length_8780_cov_13.076719_6_plen_47_part_00